MRMIPDRRRRPQLRWRAALCGIALTACADLAAPEPPPAAPPQEPAAAAAPAPKLPAEKPRRHAALPRDAEPELRLQVLAPEMLVGLDREQTALLLGPPAAVREQPPATVWSYRTKDCSLNVFFYPDVQTREMRALAYDVLAGTEGEQARNACFAAIRARAKE